VNGALTADAGLVPASLAAVTAQAYPTAFQGKMSSMTKSI
jgi:hypothetical protein